MTRTTPILITLLAGCAGHHGDTGSHIDTDTGADTAQELGPPSDETDVLVIGSGPAGMSAGYSAEMAGASWLVLEREAEGGGNGHMAGRYYGVNTEWMQAGGVQDSVEAATDDWAAYTWGGDGSDPHVQQLITRSAEILSWLVDDLGTPMEGYAPEIGQGDAPRIHSLGTKDEAPVQKLLDLYGDHVRVETEATGLVFDGDRVVGAKWHDMLTGDEGWVKARATVVATGGFGRNLAKVLEDRPELQGTNVLPEIGYPSNGGGIALLDDAGATWQNGGNMGVYVHSIPDYRPGYEGEALWVQNLQYSVMLNMDGKRFTNEEGFEGFDLVNLVVQQPQKRVIAVVPRELFDNASIGVPPYVFEGRGGAHGLLASDLVDAGVVKETQDPRGLADAWGMPADQVQATFDRYQELIDAGDDADFGKKAEGLHPFVQGYSSFEIVPGAAKAMDGFAVDVGGHVTRADGSPIPGLYAAGEVIGMLGTPAIGEGFTGSITACYLTGRVAGDSAAADIAGE